MMLDCRRDDMGPTLPIGTRVALKRPIIRLRSTRSEEDLLRFRADQGGDILTSLRDGR